MCYDSMQKSILNSKKLINCKIIKCGDYLQVYYYDNLRLITDKDIETKNEFIKSNNFENNLINKDNFENNFKSIELKNINRSKFNMERLIKSNLPFFKSFITLTFSKKICDFDYANKEFDKFITKIKRKFSGFLCVAVPEFQKNGSIHYHLLTNIDFYVSDLLVENSKTNKLYQKLSKSQIDSFINENIEEKLLKKYGKKKLNSLDFCYRLYNGKLLNTKCNYNSKSNSLKIFRTIKYWNNGFTNVIPIENINIIAYMSKYMTKDIDYRLFNRKRYYQYGNLIKPKEMFLNLNNIRDLKYFNKYQIETLVFQKTYNDYFGDNVNFIEYKLKN